MGRAFLPAAGSKHHIALLALLFLALPAALGKQVTTARPHPAAAPSAVQGPLRVHPTNPRYWTDDSGRAIYLTGSNTWNNLQDIWTTDPPRAFDYEGYLDFMQRYNHNHIRLWRWEMPKYRYEETDLFGYSQPHPWPRTGPGTAQDGKPKFDLQRFDSDYFTRLRSRTLAAQQRGIYVSIVLFEGHAMRGTIYGWETHPLHSDNNINGMDTGLAPPLPSTYVQPDQVTSTATPHLGKRHPGRRF